MALPARGRPHGTKNRDTNAAKRILEDLLGETVPEAWLKAVKKLEDKELVAQCQNYEKMMRYCYPMLSLVQVEAHIEAEHELKDYQADVEQYEALLRENISRKI